MRTVDDILEECVCGNVSYGGVIEHYQHIINEHDPDEEFREYLETKIEHLENDGTLGLAFVGE